MKFAFDYHNWADVTHQLYGNEKGLSIWIIYKVMWCTLKGFWLHTIKLTFCYFCFTCAMIIIIEVLFVLYSDHRSMVKQYICCWLWRKLFVYFLNPHFDIVSLLFNCLCDNCLFGYSEEILSCIVDLNKLNYNWIIPNLKLQSLILRLYALRMLEL